MAQKAFEPLEMPKAWQGMVKLAQNQPIESELSSGDWELLRTFTVKNNLATLVYAGAQQKLPPELRNHPKLIEIRLLAKMQRLQSQGRIRALHQIAEAFREAHIPMLSFKGPLLSMELYGDPAMRNSCDVDILVEDAKLSEACDCLRSLGYGQQFSPWEKTPKRQALHQRRNQQMHRVFRGNGVTVELHWRICYRFEVPFEVLWNRRRAFDLLGQSIDTLSRSDNLCYLITHGAGHGFRQLRWLLEIHALMQKENFQLTPVYLQMKERGVAMLLLETLLLLYRLPCLEMPESLCIEAEGTPVVRFQKNGEKTTVFWGADAKQDMAQAQKLVKAVYPLLRRNNPEEGLDGRIYKHLLPTLGHPPVFLLGLLEPYTEDLEWIDLPDRLFFLYYFLRPIHFLLRVGKKKRNLKSTPKAIENGGKTK